MGTGVRQVYERTFIFFGRQSSCTVHCSDVLTPLPPVRTFVLSRDVSCKTIPASTLTSLSLRLNSDHLERFYNMKKNLRKVPVTVYDFTPHYMSVNVKSSVATVLTPPPLPPSFSSSVFLVSRRSIPSPRTVPPQRCRCPPSQRLRCLSVLAPIFRLRVRTSNPLCHLLLLPYVHLPSKRSLVLRSNPVQRHRRFTSISTGSTVDLYIVSPDQRTVQSPKSPVKSQNPFRIPVPCSFRRTNCRSLELWYRWSLQTELW